MKKILSSIFCIILILSLFGCQKEEQKANDESYEFQGPTYNENVKYDYDLTDYIQLPEHNPITIKCDLITPTDEDVEAILEQSLLSEGNSINITDRAVKLGDRVTYNCTGLNEESQTIENSTDKTIIVGGNTYYDPFTLPFIDIELGQSKQFTVSFPADYYSTGIAGHTITYNVTVTKIEEVTPAVLSDNFVASLKIDGVTNIQQYKEYIKLGLEANAEETNYETIFNAIDNKLNTESTLLKIPENEYNYYKTQLIQQNATDARKNSIDKEQYTIKNYGSQEAFDDYVEKTAKEQVLSDLILWSLFREYNLEFDEQAYIDEMDYGFKNYSKSYGYSNKKDFEEAFSITITKAVLTKTVIDKLAETAVIN